MPENTDGPTVVQSGQGPWNFPGGSGGNGSGGNRPPPGGGGPWGGGPGGPGGRPGGPRPMSDLDQLIARAQAFIRGLLGGRGGGGGGGPRFRFTGGRPIALIGIAVVALWLASGIYRVEPDEQGVVLLFGAVNRVTGPGLRYHLPWPIERVELPAVTRINRTEIGYRSATPEHGMTQVPSESLMLTGDENIIDINLAVFWRINDAVAYLFNTRDPDALVKAVAESSIREVMGRTPIQPALTQLRAQIESDVFHQTQQILNQYHAGIEITQVQLQKVDPPDAVIESFRDVQRAATDAERMINQAEAYRNDIVPRARGDAARLVAQGQATMQASVAQATGQAQQFDAVLKAYQAAKQVTLTRMYLDTMSDILSHSHPLVVDNHLKGVLPFLPLNVPSAPSGAAPAPAATAAPPPAPAATTSDSTR
jgi:membrane protease subunit HflK